MWREPGAEQQLDLALDHAVRPQSRVGSGEDRDSEGSRLPQDLRLTGQAVIDLADPRSGKAKFTHHRPDARLDGHRGPTQTRGRRTRQLVSLQ